MKKPQIKDDRQELYNKLRYREVITKELIKELKDHSFTILKTLEILKKMV